jgi:hydroxyacylglutathione hydrolase
MFAMGCGRLFEGTAEQMYANMQRIAGLPGNVRIYCGHEYTLSNARFAAHVDPNNAEVARRLESAAAMRDAGQITLPTTVAEERATNPFVRARNVEEFARLRAEKDSFR